MDTVGIALVVGGMAFLMSGLIFLIPVRRDRSAPEIAPDDTPDPLHDRRDRVERHLNETRRNRGDVDF
jgi:hypothetical protein